MIADRLVLKWMQDTSTQWGRWYTSEWYFAGRVEGYDIVMLLWLYWHIGKAARNRLSSGRTNQRS